MVGDNSIGCIYSVRIFRTELALICACACDVLDCREKGGENIRIIIGGLVLEHRHKTLISKSGIDMLVGQRPKGSIWLTVVLYEDVVPYLQHVRIILINEMSSVSPSYPVVVDFTARSAWSLVTHLPEIIFHVARENVVFRNTN